MLPSSLILALKGLMGLFDLILMGWVLYSPWIAAQLSLERTQLFELQEAFKQRDPLQWIFFDGGNPN